MRDIILAAILIIITYTDLNRQEIDNEPIILGLGFIILFSLCGYNNVSIKSSIAGFLIGGIFFTILAFWGMGGGDIKLMALIGFFLGWKFTILVMYLSFVLGSIMGIGYIIMKRKKIKEHIPFGPAIAVATMLVLIYGQQMVANSEFLWYLR